MNSLGIETVRVRCRASSCGDIRRHVAVLARTDESRARGIRTAQCVCDTNRHPKINLFRCVFGRDVA